MKIKVAQDEWYVWVPTSLQGRRAVVLDVPVATARRWKKAVEDFNKVTAEIAAQVGSDA